MNKDIECLLISADDPIGVEQPDTDIPVEQRSEMTQSVSRICERLVNEIGLSLESGGAIQDASFFCELCQYVEIGKTEEGGTQAYVQIGIRFSNFGHLVSIYSAGRNELDNFPLREIAKVIEEENWTYVDADALDAPYNGLNERLIDGKFSWWNRYFDYI